MTPLEHMIKEQYEIVEHALPKGVTFDDWYDNGAELAAFDHDDETHDTAVFAVGYLAGVGDALQLTILDVVRQLRDRGLLA